MHCFPRQKEQHRILLEVEVKFEMKWVGALVNNQRVKGPLKMCLASPWPALEGGDDEKGEHGVKDVVVVKARPLPHPLFNWNRGKSVRLHKQRRLSALSFCNQLFIYYRCK
jgi:hypothetical protein